MANLRASATIQIDVPISKVWEALTKPEVIKEYMFGTNVVTDWKVGSGITWEGEWKGERYKDEGEILEIEEERRLKFTHFSPLSGDADIPENYHTVTFELDADSDSQTTVTITQDGSKDVKARDHSQENWQLMLNELKRLLEDDQTE